MTEAIAVFETGHEGPLDDEVRRLYQAQINDTLATTFLTDTVAFRLRACHLGDLHVTHAIATARSSERTPARIGRDQYAGIAVQLALAGRSCGSAEGRAVDSVPGSIMLLDFSRPFTMIDRETREVINVSVPRDLLAGRIEIGPDLHGRVLQSADAMLLGPLLANVAERFDRLPVAAGPVLANHCMDLLLLALGHDPSGALPATMQRRAPLLDRACLLVGQYLGSADLSPEWIASRLGISRNDLYGLFESVGGVSRYIWKQRLDAAQQALCDLMDERRIGEIAFSLGFTSEAHFSRAYRTAFGTTPSATRRARSTD